MDVVRADAHVPLARPELKRAWVDVEESGAGEARAHSRRDAVGGIDQQRVARPFPEAALVERALPDHARIELADRATREVGEHHTVAQAQLVDVGPELGDARLVEPRFLARPEQLEPPSVVAEIEKTAQVLDRYPEVAAAGQVLGDELGTEEDGRAAHS
ncbi:MAG: hypothetical protein IPK07_17235 [Deltaproteobacteria bacterium]|nr:hypothetical protein [Deltaproteobacteria bacterium]